MNEQRDGHTPSDTETTTARSEFTSEPTYSATSASVSGSPGQPPPTFPYESESAGPAPSGTAQAKEEAGNVAQTASQSGKQVAGAAAEQGRRIADEAAQQARNLLDDARQQVSRQAGDQQHKAAESLRALGDELATMADGSHDQGLGSQLVRQASDQVQQVASWLSDSEPGSVLDDVRGFAQRRPGTFLLAAAAAGLLAGRLTRGAVDERRNGSGGNGDVDSVPAAQRSGSGLDYTHYPDAVPAVPTAEPSAAGEGTQRL
jgi:hypothetical protein